MGLILTEWTKSTPFEGIKNKEGLISESTAALVFEGEIKKGPDGSRILEGILQRANTQNRNGRIYPFHILERENTKLQRAIKENGGILGEMDHPETVTINLQKTCQRIDELQMDRTGLVTGRITLVPSLPLGMAAIGVCDALGGKPGQSSRGAGSLFSKNGATMVGEDYSMKTYDMVHDPSTHGARPEAVSEALIREFVEFANARPSTKKLRLGNLVDRYLGFK